MKKYLLFFVLIFVGAESLSAQWKVGVQSGYSLNSISTTVGYFYDRKYESAAGLTVGVPVQYGFTDWFALGAELSYVQKNYCLQRSGYYSALHETVTNEYLSVPLYAHFSFGGKKLRGFLNAGVYGGAWLASHREGVELPAFPTPGPGNYQGVEESTDLYGYDEDVDFDDRRDNRIECGTMLGVGLQYQVLPFMQIFAEGRYYYSLTDMQKDYMINQVPRYNNTIGLQVGILFTVGK